VENGDDSILRAGERNVCSTAADDDVCDSREEKACMPLHFISSAFGCTSGAFSYGRVGGAVHPAPLCLKVGASWMEICKFTEID